jgi:hypothetical protein
MDQLIPSPDHLLAPLAVVLNGAGIPADAAGILPAKRA